MVRSTRRGPSGRAVAQMSHSAIYVTDVRHRRHRPARHVLRHRTFHVLIDIDELAALDRDVRGFGWDRWAPMSFRGRDHLDGTDAPIRERLDSLLRAHGSRLPAGRLQVLSHPRTFGHVFNPVAWWFAYEPDGQLALVVAEVTSTFGDRAIYVLDALEDRGDGVLYATANKRLHVSPFLPVEGHQYRFVLRPPGTPPGERVVVHMEVDDAAGTILDATQDGRRWEFSSRGVRRILLRHPFVSLASLAAIHLHALRLWLKRVPFHRRPTPPSDALAVRGRPTGDLRNRR